MVGLGLQEMTVVDPYQPVETSHSYAMNLRFLVSALLLAFGMRAFAETPNLDSYSDSELWDAADLVALVRIESGRYTKDVGIDVAAMPLEILKGELERSLKISAHYSLLDSPDQLGSTYLVFLAESGDGHYSLLHESRSSVRITYVEIDDDMAIRMHAPKPSDEARVWYSYNGSLWVVDCVASAAYRDKMFCENGRSIVDYAMKRVGGTQGQ